MTNRAAWLLRTVPLAQHRETAWKDMLEAVKAEVPTYDSFSEAADKESWEAGVRSLLDLVVALVLEDRWFRPMEIQALRTAGCTRADQGVSLPAVRRAIRIAAAVGRKWVLQAYTPTTDEDRAGLIDLLDTFDRFADAVVDAMSEGYLARKQQQEADRERRRARFFEEVLAGTIVAEDEAVRRATTIGCDPGVARALVLVPPSPCAAGLDALLQSRSSDIVVVPLESSPTPHAVYVVPARTANEWAAAKQAFESWAHKSATTVLWVSPSRGLVQLRDRHAGAVRLVPFLDRIAGRKGAVDVDDVALDALIAHVPADARRAFTRRILHGVLVLPVAERSALLDALRTHIDCNYVGTEVAEALGVNVKTAYARRDALEDATGVSLGDARGQLLLSVAYHAYRLDAEP